MSNKTFFVFHNTIAHYNMSRKDIDVAQKVWQKILDYATEISDNGHRITCCLWVATCLRQKRELSQAYDIPLEAIDDAKRYNYERLIISCQIELIEIEIFQGSIEHAAALLMSTHAMAHRYQDRVAIAVLQRLYARLHTLRGDPAARAALAEAIDLFERMGMRRELAEARAEQARLDEPITATG